MSVLGGRLKEARQRAGLSQESVGLDAGLEPASARTRMNRYETGARAPDYEVMTRIAAVLDVPVAYFYAAEDELAELLRFAHRLSGAEREELLKVAREIGSSDMGASAGGT